MMKIKIVCRFQDFLLRQFFCVADPVIEFLKDLENKIKISKKLKEQFDFSIISKMSIMNSHGDYSVQQLIYNNEKETSVIDFESAKRLPINHEGTPGDPWVHRGYVLRNG